MSVNHATLRMIFHIIRIYSHARNIIHSLKLLLRCPVSALYITYHHPLAWILLLYYIGI